LKVTAPKSGTVTISVILFIIGIGMLATGIIGILNEYRFYLDLGGLILVIIAWVLLFLGTLITGL
jgi:hypothetical protein